jgi:hypothetical protein
MMCLLLVFLLSVWTWREVREIEIFISSRRLGTPPEMDYPIKPNSVDGASLFASVGFLLSIPTLGRRGIGAAPSKTAMIARRDDTSSSCWRLTRRSRLLGR